MHGDAAARRQHVDGLIILRLGKPHRLVVDHHAGVAERGAEPRVIFQGADAAVDIDRGVDLGVAGIGDGDRFVARALGRQHVGNGADQLGAFRE